MSRTIRQSLTVMTFSVSKKNHNVKVLQSWSVSYQPASPTLNIRLAFFMSVKKSTQRNNFKVVQDLSLSPFTFSTSMLK